MKTSRLLIGVLLFFHFVSQSAMAETTIYSIRMLPRSPADMENGEYLTVRFKYRTDRAVRIFVRPFTGCEKSRNYRASPSPLYPPGNGSGDSDFTISNKRILVDRIGFRIKDDRSGRILKEIFIPVEYNFY
jgi:hypothetical protein